MGKRAPDGKEWFPVVGKFSGLSFESLERKTHPEVS